VNSQGKTQTALKKNGLSLLHDKSVSVKDSENYWHDLRYVRRIIVFSGFVLLSGDLSAVQNVSLQTILVKLKHGGRENVVRALHDSGCQKSYILQKTAVKMGSNLYKWKQKYTLFPEVWKRANKIMVHTDYLYIV
jgi:hypothetical protein